MARTSNSVTVRVVTNATTLAQAANSLSSGQGAVFSMPGLNLTAVSPESVPTSAGFAGRMYWDQVRKKMYFWGTSHTGSIPTAGAGVMNVYDEATHTVQRTTYTWDAGGSNIMGHNYYDGTINPNDGALYHAVAPGTTHLFQTKPVGTTTWSQASIPSFPSDVSFQWSYGVEWFQELNGGAGGIAVCDYLRFFWTNATLTAWNSSATMSPQLPAGDYWSAKVSGFMHVGEGTVHRRMAADGTVSARAAPPMFCGTNNDPGGTVIPHPNGIDLLLLERDGSRRVWKYTQSSNSWGSVIGNHTFVGPIVLMQTVPDHNIVMGWSHESNGAGATVCRIWKVPA